MAKRTISSYFLPKPNDIEKTNPENESDSDCEETVVAKKGRKFSFGDEWLRVHLAEVFQGEQLNELHSAVDSHNMLGTCSDKTGTTQLKHDTLIKHNASLKHKTELPTLTVSPCDTRFCMFSRSHATQPISHCKRNSDFGPRRVGSFSNSATIDGAKERIYKPIRCIDILFTPKSPGVSNTTPLLRSSALSTGYRWLLASASKHWSWRTVL